MTLQKRIPALFVCVSIGSLAVLLTHTRTIEAQTPVHVVTQRNDNFRTGANLAETTLTPTAVGSGRFGLLYSLEVEGQVYAQPLYVSALSIQGATRNVLFVATEHNNVYAFDADAGAVAPLWAVNLGPSAPQDPEGDDATVPGCYNLTPEVGITSTPVIDVATQTIYVVAKTRDADGNYHQRIHALNLVNGSTRRSAEILAAVGDVTFDPRMQLNRPGLLLVNGAIYVAFGSHCDLGTYRAWVMGYDAATLNAAGVYLGTPDGNGAIWQSGLGLAADAAGSIYAVTANGLFTDDKRNLSNSILRLARSGSTLAAVDSFTPFNTDYLTEQDADLGSSGAMLIPNTNLVLSGSKEGKLYLANRSNLGGFSPFEDQVVQSFQATDTAFSNNIHGAPVYWSSPAGPRLYMWAENEAMKSFAFDGSRISETPVQQSLIFAPWNAMPGGAVSLSANGSASGTGVVWAGIAQWWDATNTPVGGVLRAFDAENLTNEIWTSDLNAGDELGLFSKFSPPTVVAGKVFMATFSGAVRVYGLRDGSGGGGGGGNGGGTSTPFGGVAAAIPGVVQAENFDDGGENVAYHDLSVENSGGAYRVTRVDIEAASDNGGGYDVGWMQAGEWLQYTVAVQTAGTYTVAARVASDGGGGTFHIEVNGADKTGPITVLDTGGWQAWQTVTTTEIALDAGQQRVRVVVDSDGMNLNLLTFTSAGSTPPPPTGSTPFGGTARPFPGSINAAAFDEGGEGVAYHDTTPGNSGGEYRDTDVDIQSSIDSGGGYNVGWMKPGEWLVYSVNVATAGSYRLTFRVAAPFDGAIFHLELDGVNITGPLTIPNTGDYQGWQDVSTTVTVPAGAGRARFVVDAARSGVGNFRSITATLLSGPPPPPPPPPPPGPTVPGVIAAADFDNGGEGVSWHDTSSGNNGGAYRQTDVDIEDCNEGGYDVAWIAAGEWLNYTVDVAAAGTYTVQLRVAAPTIGASMHVGFNNASNVWQSVVIPATGDWQEWRTISVPVTLGAGRQQMTLFFDTRGFNISRITIVR